MNRLDIVLVIKGVIESVVGVVISVVLNLGVQASIKLTNIHYLYPSHGVLDLFHDHPFEHSFSTQP